MAVRRSLNATKATPVRVADVLMQHGKLKKVRLPFELSPMKFMQHWHARQDADPANMWLRDIISAMTADESRSEAAPLRA